MLIGVTGGIGAGKSVLCALFAEWGAHVVDADALGHEILYDPRVIRQLCRSFGARIMRADGSVDRGRLGRLAFAERSSWERLQRIVRAPLGRRLWEAVVRAESIHPVVVVDAALIFEWRVENRFDLIVLVDAEERIRIRRVQARSGLTAHEIRRRMSFQIPSRQLRARADIVVENDGDEECLRHGARAVWRQIQSRCVEAGMEPSAAPGRRMIEMTSISRPRPQSVQSCSDSFVDRHVGLREADVQTMLERMGIDSLDGLLDRTVPSRIRRQTPLGLGDPISELELRRELERIAARNQAYRSYIGLGYADCVMPAVIQRGILENPGWYTHYTPYQAEIAQGRLEALLNFQTMVSDLTGMELANASLLDEATSAAEAMSMLAALRRSRAEKQLQRFFVSEDCHPQTIAVLKTRARWRDWEVVVGDHRDLTLNEGWFGVLLQYPTTDGRVPDDYAEFVQCAHQANVRVAVAADLLALCVLVPPGDWGADVVVGSTQRFGLPMGCGGPHAAYFATRGEYRRQTPGRIIGISRDVQGKLALRMALQTREQHIRREKATSNICTAQVLPAVIAGMYAVYHGPDGLRRIAERVHHHARLLAAGAERLGMQVVHEAYFDTVRLRPAWEKGADGIRARAEQAKVNLRYFADGDVGITLDETTRDGDLEQLLCVLAPTGRISFGVRDLDVDPTGRAWRPEDERHTRYLEHEVFSRYHSETEMMRYMFRLQGRDLSLTTSMTPLGSCTMKLNGAAQMMPLTWPSFTAVHPFAPAHQAAGYGEIFAELGGMLGEITGLPAVSFQPNSGAQGEFTGLMVIRSYHASRGQDHRDVCLIPSSAHGTNPASAVMAGMRVVVVECDSKGNVDLEDLRSKASTHGERLASLMITYPSTHGVFETGIVEICSIVHEHGGQVYMDGANMNAQVGLCRPADLGVDICHLNLHKTFGIPHGGGGPGMGPVAAAPHLRPFLPAHPLAGEGEGTGPVAAAPWGSALVLLIPWAYLKLLGAEGATRATVVAILNANYVAHRLDPYYPVLFRGEHGWVAHEAIVDLRPLKRSAGVTVEDVAKRLMDYGFHAPTVSFPVPGTLMIEPTESESLAELDRFCEAMIAIREEVAQIERGVVKLEDSPLTHAPHTVEQVCSAEWTLPYSREQAALPAAWLRESKFWPCVGRIDNAQGDRHLVCKWDEARSGGGDQSP